MKSKYNKLVEDIKKQNAFLMVIGLFVHLYTIEIC